MLKLGNFIFAEDDMPSELPMGGTSLNVVDRFPGGYKSVQDFGAFDDPVSLRGTFMYAGAVQKMNQINKMWFDGKPLLFSAPGFSPRYVQITSFKPNYHNDYQIDYDITLEPLTSADLNAILYGQSSTTTTTSSSSSSSTVSSASGPAPKPAAPQKYYIVKSGDSLWKIAAKPSIYGNGSMYTKIVSANNIKNPNLIYPGQKLVIP